jgi:hypothetical protein
MIDVLAEQGYTWTLVSSAPPSRLMNKNENKEVTKKQNYVHEHPTSTNNHIECSNKSSRLSDIS